MAAWSIDRPAGRRPSHAWVPVVWGFAAVLLAAPAMAQPAARPAVGQNLALGAAYRLFPPPNYSYCTDPGDKVQLTDGQSTTNYFWTQTGTVGWSGAAYATVTVDLGRIEPIGGVALTTAAGAAGVTWPMAVQVLTSDDGKTYHDAGDLVALDHKVHGRWPDGYAIRRLVTKEIRSRGRFVQFVIVPLPGGPYLFVDEVEVFRGPPALRQKEPAGEIVAGAKEIFEHGRLRRSLRQRLADDVESLDRAIAQAPLASEAERKRLRKQLDGIARQVELPAAQPEGEFRAVLPMGDEHARLFGVQGELWRALGNPPLSAWKACRWDPLDPFALPAPSNAPLRVDTMRGEYRAAAFNLANATDRTMEVRIRVVGLPGGAAPEYLTVHQVEWTDTSRLKPIAAALPEARSDANGWLVDVRPGLVRQVWLSFHTGDLPAGDYGGAIRLETQGTGPVEIPLVLKVWPLKFPRQTTLLLGGWSYTDGDGYGITPENRRPLLRHLKEHFVNAPWASSGVMRQFEFDAHDASKIHLDTERFDRWITDWPQARQYMVFLSVAHYSGALKTTFGGAEIGSQEFARRVGTWISAWVEHLHGKGIEPQRLGLLIHDEPHEGSQIEPFLAWARAIRAAQPEVVIWEDPTYRDPAKAPPELFQACDVLCPNRPMWLARGEPFEQFYRGQGRQGRTLQFYSCSGPAKLLDPYSYYRLQAWQAWDIGGTGSFFWAFGDNSGASSWNEYFTSRGPYTPLFLDDRSVTAGKHMEAIRESVEDYEYFVMLREAVRRAKAGGVGDAALRRAEQLLRGAAGEVLAGKGAMELTWHAAKDRTLADAVRVRILEALAALE